MARSELQVEIDKRDPFDSVEQEAYLNLARTQSVLAQEFERLFQQHGLSAPQYNVLRILRGYGGEGVSCLQIAKNMVHRMPDITRLGDRLEQAGLVTRGRTEEDRRVVLLKITPLGVDRLAVLDEPVRQLHKKQLGHLHADELAALSHLLAEARRPLIAPANPPWPAAESAAMAADGSAAMPRDVAKPPSNATLEAGAPLDAPSSPAPT